MRLTQKSTNPNYYGQYMPNDNANYDDDVCVDKLGQLEDIEDELGISLTTLFEALHNGVYAKNHLYKVPRRIKLVCDDKDEFWIQFYLLDDEHFTYYKVKDYGKTWALTKEELE